MRLAAALALLAVACSGPPPDDGLGDVKSDTKQPAPRSTSGNKTTPSQPTSSDGVDAGAPKAPADAGGADSGDAGTQPSWPFRELDVRYVVDAGLFLTQCTPDTATQYVWKTTASGTDAYARFADPAYPQPPNVLEACGTKTNGTYPIVLTWTNDGVVPHGTYVAKCVARGTAEVYQVTGAVDGHPAATYLYPENHPACP